MSAAVVSGQPLHNVGFVDKKTCLYSGLAQIWTAPCGWEAIHPPRWCPQCNQSKGDLDSLQAIAGVSLTASQQATHELPFSSLTAHSDSKHDLSWGSSVRLLSRGAWDLEPSVVRALEVSSLIGSFGVCQIRRGKGWFSVSVQQATFSVLLLIIHRF
jgi:hypothetical protein